jgi:hypothetical protein
MGYAAASSPTLHTAKSSMKECTVRIPDGNVGKARVQRSFDSRSVATLLRASLRMTNGLG